MSVRGKKKKYKMSRFDFNLIRVLSKQGVRQRRHLSGLRKKGPSVVKKISLESRYEKSYHIFTLFSYSFCVTFAYKVIRHVHNFFWSHCMMIIHWLVRLLLKWQKWPKWQFGVVVWPLWFILISNYCLIWRSATPLEQNDHPKSFFNIHLSK